MGTSPWPGSGTFSIARTSPLTGLSSSLSPGAYRHSSSSAVPASISRSSPQPTCVPISRVLQGHPPSERPGSAGSENRQQNQAEHWGGGGGGGSRQDKGEFEAVFPFPWASSELQPWKTPWSEDSNPVGERETFHRCCLFLLPFPTVCWNPPEEAARARCLPYIWLYSSGGKKKGAIIWKMCLKKEQMGSTIANEVLRVSGLCNEVIKKNLLWFNVSLIKACFFPPYHL